MNIAQIESNLQKLIKSFNEDSFIYDLLLAYGQPKASIKRLQQGGLNLSKHEGEIIWKKKLFFKSVKGEDLHGVIDSIKSDDKALKQDPRFIIVTDFKTLLAIDRKTSDTLDVPIAEIAKHFDFFLPWAGMEKAQHQNENPADVKAAERMAKLYDEIKKDNPTKTPEEVHNLNVFLSRLLFCFFAEDTGIFESVQFTNSIASHTQTDGSDLQSYLDKLFEVLNTEPTKRHNLSAYLEAFPYVNGGLFRNKHHAPAFTRRSRQALIDSGQLEWKDINPDIFGSMIQAVITPEHRGGLGMHYTSVPNIMKVIEPLFLNELYEEFEATEGNDKALYQLLKKIWNIKIFDPACGSGNFLIIGYKELRKLEMKIFKALNNLALSNISLGNFYGIEIDDFAHEVATLSLWLAEHQMNQEFFKEFGRTKPALPLKETGNIVHGNATRVDWEEVCPKKAGDEIYILGNPPYLGGKKLSNEQSKDMDLAGLSEMKQLDYICCWFLKATDFIDNPSAQSKYAFVSTSSICQGEQVHLLWSHIFKKRQAIEFAYKPFPWSNNARDKAGVVCTIIGVTKAEVIKLKYLFDDTLRTQVDDISPYLIKGRPILIEPKSESLSNLPKMVMGSNPIDGTNLILEDEEYDFLIKNKPESVRFIKRYMGGNDFIKNTQRHCLWIDDKDVIEARKISLIDEKLEKCRKYRLKAGRDARKVANTPHRFCYRTHKDSQAIIFPKTTSSNRKYIPCGITQRDTIIYEAAFAIYDVQPFLLGVLSSQMHNTWLSTACGRLGSGYRYSVKLCYNTFPFPPTSELQKQEIEKQVYNVLHEREQHSEKTLAQLYDPDKMPRGLKEAHHRLDLAVERCYRSKPFETDEERLEYLFKLYEQMIAEEQTKGTLFEVEKKPKKKKK